VFNSKKIAENDFSTNNTIIIIINRSSNNSNRFIKINRFLNFIFYFVLKGLVFTKTNLITKF
jgi:hypothetical protein